MRRSIKILLFILCTALFLSQCNGNKTGAKATELSISEWIQGDAITLSEGKGSKIYVVEFWATWCPPCRTSIPHINELAQEYDPEDIIFIGITTEDADTVADFVDEMGEDMTYRVAIDRNGVTSKAYGVRGIPHAFIVDLDGTIAWEGHPMNNMGAQIDKLL